MATTTASVSISSSDLQVGNQLALNASTTCMKAGLTTGLEKIEMGKNTLTVAGDWLFIPWSQNDHGAQGNDLIIQAIGGSCAYEYAIFKEDETVVAGA